MIASPGDASDQRHRLLAFLFLYMKKAARLAIPLTCVTMPNANAAAFIAAAI